MIRLLRRIIMKKRLTLLVAAAVIAASLAGCGGSSASSEKSYAAPQSEGGAYAEEAMADYEAWDYDEAPAEQMSTAGSSSDSEGGAPTDEEIMSNSNRKLIRTVNMTVETREFDSLVANVTDRIESLGGYAQSMDISGNSYDSSSGARTAYIVARIPANKLDHFVDNIEKASNITSKNESAEDVTLQYADVEAHKESLKIEQQRLNELLEQADTLENIIELEDRLTQVRYEIESYESRLRTMNNQVTYSTVNLSIREVKEYTPEPVEELTFGQRLARGFLDSCAEAWEAIQDFIIGFVSFLPMLLVVLIILFFIFLIIFGIVKAIIAIARKMNKNRPPKAPKAPKKSNAVQAKALSAPPQNPPAQNGEAASQDPDGENR